MTSTQYDLPSLEASWFRKAPRASFSDAVPYLLPVPHQDARRPRRRLVKAVGYACIAVLSASVAWMATSTQARGVITSWGTMGSVAQVRLLATQEPAVPVEPDLALEMGTIPWARAIAPAELSLDTDVVPEPSGLTLAVTTPAVWRTHGAPADDPYAGVTGAAREGAVPATGGLEEPY